MEFHLNDLALEDLVGQVLCPDISSKDDPESVVKMLREQKPGGIFVTHMSREMVKYYTDVANEVSKVPIVVCSDVENGPEIAVNGTGTSPKARACAAAVSCRSCAGFIFCRIAASCARGSSVAVIPWYLLYSCCAISASLCSVSICKYISVVFGLSCLIYFCVMKRSPVISCVLVPAVCLKLCAVILSLS